MTARPKDNCVFTMRERRDWIADEQDAPRAACSEATNEIIKGSITSKKGEQQRTFADAADCVRLHYD